MDFFGAMLAIAIGSAILGALALLIGWVRVGRLARVSLAWLPAIGSFIGWLACGWSVASGVLLPYATPGRATSWSAPLSGVVMLGLFVGLPAAAFFAACAAARQIGHLVTALRSRA